MTISFGKLFQILTIDVNEFLRYEKKNRPDNTICQIGPTKDVSPNPLNSEHNTLLFPHPIRWRHNALMIVVCLSVCPVPDPMSRMKGHDKLKIGRKDDDL